MTNAIRNGALLLVLALALIWPALYNGQPFFFPDTTAYLRGADTAIEKATRHKTPWSASGSSDIVSANSASSAENSVKDKTVLSGRSPYYGALLYFGEVTGGFWLAILIQGLAVLFAVALLLRAVGVFAWRRFALICLALSAATSLPFYTSMLMPDLFAGVTILACCALVGTRRALPRTDCFAWLMLLTAALIFHDSHVLIAAGMVVLALISNLRRGWGNGRGIAVIIAALCLAAVAQVAFNFAATRVTGSPPLRPPFLMARLIDDGPGYRYLKASCPGNGFTVCQYLGRLPLEADAFLWATGTPASVFSDAPGAIKRKLSTEQFSFVAHVVQYDPTGVATAMMRDAALQLMRAGLSEFSYDRDEAAFFDAKVPAEHLDTMHRSAAYTGAIPIHLFAAVQGIVAIAAMAFILFAFWRGSALKGMDKTGAWLLIGMFINGAVCGMFSGPHDRYSVRVLWLLPFAALMFVREVWPIRLRLKPLLAPQVTQEFAPAGRDGR